MSSSSSSTPPSAAPEPDLSGRQLGDYRVLRRLGRGGMAEVYLAEQGSLKRQVAIKVLKGSLAQDEKFIKRFRMEAQAAASLVHPSIVQIHEVGCKDGIHYIAQEYVPGQNLRERLAREGTLDLRLVLKILRQVASALLRAAEKGIVHRDIKPENIMLSSTGEVKVADFGLARLMRDEDAVQLTQVGMTMGTPLYMSPEQVEGRPLDVRSDIYSLGVTCYHMLAGQPPFRGETALSVAVQHLKSQAERLENSRPDLPKGVCRIIHRMLAKEVDQRYRNPRELLKELRELRIEGDDDDAWEESLPADDPLRSEDHSTGRVLATQRLDSLMKTTAVPRTKRRSAWVYAMTAIAAIVLGAVVARAVRPRFLLSEARGLQGPVERQSTARAQYLYAELVKTESAWQAVIDNFPNDDFYKHQAERELALIYLERKGSEERAKEIFDQLAALGDHQAEFRAVGLAGQAAVLSIEKKYQESAEKLATLVPLFDKLDPRYQQIVSYVVKKNDRALNRETDSRWNDLLRERLGSE